MQGEPLDFSNRIAIVTGSSGALGSAVVDRFADAGATVCAVDRLPATASDSLLDPDIPASTYEADLTDESEVEAVIQSVQRDHGGIDHVLNIAGTWRGGTPIEETDVETVEFLMDVNFKTAFLMTKYALSELQERSGTIVNVSAKSSLAGGSGDGPYRISKAGIRLLTESVAKENVGSVRSNCVMPSVIDTPANREMMDEADVDSWVKPDAIADVMLVLSSDLTRATSGAAIPVYGEKL